MIAGMYIGELVRYILLDLCKNNIVFSEDCIGILERPGAFHFLIPKLQNDRMDVLGRLLNEMSLRSV